MKHAFSLVAAFLIAFGAAAFAFASPDQSSSPVPHGSQLREQMRAIQIEEAMLQKDQQHGLRPAQSAENVQQEVEAGQDLQGTEAAPSTTEEARRANHMSPEERRALRRQIDDAGHEIYTAR